MKKTIIFKKKPTEPKKTLIFKKKPTPKTPEEKRKAPFRKNPRNYA